MASRIVGEVSRSVGEVLYINVEDLIEWLKETRQNQRISPYMDTALLNIQQLLQSQLYSPFFADYVQIGGCDDCRWKNRKQKCSCCRRNRHLKDCYEEE